MRACSNNETVAMTRAIQVASFESVIVTVFVLDNGYNGKRMYVLHARDRDKLPVSEVRGLRNAGWRNPRVYCKIRRKRHV